MRNINDLHLLKKRVENELNTLTKESNKTLVKDYAKRVARLKKHFSILEDTISYYPLISYVYGEEVELDILLGKKDGV
jgi:hypothetical protein